MFEIIQDILTQIAALLCGFAIGGIWIGVIVVPNEAFDHMDHTRADQHVRGVLRTGSIAIAAALILAAVCAAVGGAYGAAALAGLSAFGFFTNRLTLARPDGKSTSKEGGQTKKSPRVIAVALSLIFGVAVLGAGILSVAGL